jgi:hypothetical protein
VWPVPGGRPFGFPDSPGLNLVSFAISVCDLINQT